ncbi:IPT/TIG domain-containing protein [Nonomuraea turcica]|uniref:IPT/TIG domain-containing protein n=1 Tax=Nonomuraea sp. G32 TaxID=3067274 RepID=UPI00273C66B2|nr:IPT/TIG domain-containing protein [Nonomuraea sp. G32]MDP4502093.1 IPT/TIG domain-containing protein [Nonomuraea sp. G32]
MAPVVSSVTPHQGSFAGGTSVTITGSGFGGASAARFGGTQAAGFVLVSSTKITAISPPGAGTVNVTVTGSSGSSTQTVPFTYVNAPAPIITALAPNTGPEAGGTTVTVTGSGFTGATQVRFGALASSFTVVSGSQLTATAPATGPAPVLVTVTTPAGTSNPAPFCYFATTAPVVTGIAPSGGPLAGGNTATITGSGFAGATQVRFGAVASGFTVVSDSEVTATAPGGSGTVPITVTTPDGSSAGDVHYSYVAAPTIVSLNPSEGPSFGGNSVTIVGTGFTDVTGVLFGASPAPFSIVSDTQIVATPSAGSGTVMVTMVSAGGSSSPGVPYTYLA